MKRSFESTYFYNSLDEMEELVRNWCSICSGSGYLKGLFQMKETLKKNFLKLEPELIEEFDLPSAKILTRTGKWEEVPTGTALLFRKRTRAPIQIFLGGHMDTVYGPESSFQTCKKNSPNILSGPGTADMKGGLVILLKTLEAFEKLSSAPNIGWSILITPDEESGSLGSASLIKDCAKNSHLALLFEPSHADGCLVSSRLGSYSYVIAVQGKKAHAGRDFENGRSAIAALCHWICEIDKIKENNHTLSLNIGWIEGGEAYNIIADKCLCSINIRTSTLEKIKEIENKMSFLMLELGKEREVIFSLYPLSQIPPRIFDKASEKLYHELRRLGQYLGFDLNWKVSGGVSDGNILSTLNIPLIDTLGAVGSHLHTHEEYIEINSLANRSALTYLLLKEISEGKIQINI